MKKLSNLSNSEKFWYIVWFGSLIVLTPVAIFQYLDLDPRYRGPIFWTWALILVWYQWMLTIIAFVTPIVMDAITKFNNFLNKPKN